MAPCLRIGVIGDFDADRATHPATNAALEHAGHALHADIDVAWLSTPALEEAPDAALDHYDAFVGAPGSPYRSLDGALRGIRYAREHPAPYLGTCGGFQHAVLEYARGALGMTAAQHGEYEPEAAEPLIAPLRCSVAGRILEVRLDPDSRAGRCYGRSTSSENFRCSYGLNEGSRRLIDASDLRVVGRDADGEARVVELRDHPFFIAALYVPQLRSTPEAPHPLLTGLIRAALGQRRERHDLVRGATPD